MKDAGVPDYKALLTEAIDVIEGLAGQQAMRDDWFEAPLGRFMDAVGTPDPVNYAGKKLSVGPGWRLVNADCIEVDGVRYAFYYSGKEDGFISRDPIGGSHIKPDNTSVQALADQIRTALVYGDGPDDIGAEAAMEGSAST